MHLDEPRIVEKQWGGEIILVDTPVYCCKRLIIEPGRQCSLHRHRLKSETFVLVSGLVFLQIDSEHILMTQPETSIRVGATRLHRFGSIDGAELLEVSTRHDDADVERLQPSGPFCREDWTRAADYLQIG